MVDHDAIERVAHRLADAYVTGTSLSGHEVLGDDAPIAAADGYAVQVRMREIAGVDVAAWKVGASSDAAQQLLGVEAPFIGGVDRARVVESGTEFVIDDWFTGAPFIEVEVGLRTTVDLDELPDDPMELAESVEVVPCIEVVDSRFGAIVGPPGACLIADNGVASALVVGDALMLDAGAIRQLDALQVSLVVDGGEPVEGVASMALGHPLVALHTAARVAIDVGTPIRAGQVVSTGTCTGLTPVAIGTSIIGHVGPAMITTSFA